MNKHHCLFLAIAKAPKFLEEISDRVLSVGDNVNLETRLSAFPTPDVVWTKDGIPLRGAPNIDFISLPCGKLGIW